MDFLKIFRRRTDPIFLYNSNKSGYELLNEGLLFEETNTFLKWGTAIEELSNKNQVRKERRSDRTIYRWGEQTILSGLRLDLSTIYWDHQAVNDVKRLNSIGFWSIGDKEAEKHLERISSHLEEKLGLPVRKEIDKQDVSLEWRIKEIKLSINYFERHAYKLHFQIEKTW